MNSTLKRDRPSKREAIDKILAMTIALLLVSLMLPVSATAAPIIDTSQHGSLTIKVSGSDGTTGLNGVQYSYMKVADVDAGVAADASHTLVYSNVDTSFLAAIGSPAADVSTPSNAYRIAGLQAALTAHVDDAASAGLGLSAMAATVGGAANTPAATTASNLSIGLYLVVQTGGPSNVELESYTEPFLVSLPTGNATAWTYDIVSTAKNVTNDEVITRTVDKESVSIGGTANYTIAATAGVTSLTTRYTAYNIADVLPLGVTPPTTAQVVVTSSSLTLTPITDYTVTVLGTSVQVGLTASGLTKLNSISAPETISIKYSAKLNTLATIGGLGNTSTATLTYAHTLVPGVPKIATVTVSSYGFTLKKVSSLDGHPVLGGAKFKLYATQADALAGTNPLSFYAGLLNAVIVGSPVAETATSLAGLSSFYGLGAGDYYLVETEAPAGYTMVGKPVKVTVDASTTGVLPAVTIENSPQSGNTGGIVLPVTGGGGVIAFAIGGVALMLAAGFAAFKLMRKRGDSKK